MKKTKTTTQLEIDMPHNPNKLFVAFEMGNEKWVLCFCNGKRLRHRQVDAGAQSAVLKEIGLAKEKFGFEKDCEVHSCYEAGRDGFWPHRFLEQQGVKNRVFDPASIEVDRRHRRKKTDRVDAEKLVRLLMRIVLCGEKKVCAEVRIPTLEQEAVMRVHRERERLVKERTAHRGRLRSLLCLHGIKLKSVDRLVPGALRDWQGQTLPAEMVQELEREVQRLQQIQEQVEAVEKEQRQRLKEPQAKETQKAAQLMVFKGVGLQCGWLLAHEFFWRQFNNRREVGACAGLTGSPYDSGESERELGIGKAGNRRVRTLCIEMAWNWLRFQPQSQLSQWFLKKFAQSKRSKRVGIVALARKLLVALWKYLHFGLVPEGALLK
jgi:transposase